MLEQVLQRTAVLQQLQRVKGELSQPRDSRRQVATSAPTSIAIDGKRQNRVRLVNTARQGTQSTPVAMTFPQASTIYATQPGGTTLDQDDCGGNPFATALIELSQKRDLKLRDLLPALRESTLKKSAKRQVPIWDHLQSNKTWAFSLGARKRPERRLALVLIVSEYLRLAVPRLLGAANDERRIAAMLAGQGFSVLQGVAPNRQSLLSALRSFAVRSTGFDVAVLYSTGHGVDLEGRAYLLPGDYPFQCGYDAAVLRQHAVPVSRIAAACRARKVNLTFFAGCRAEVRHHGQR
jgi:hypothetical protein